MKKLFIILGAVLFAAPLQTRAQKLALEKTYEITGKARRGYLDEVQYDPATQNTKLSFVTRATGNFTGSKTKVKYQDYTFDKDFNFVKMGEAEQDYRNTRYKGETYSTEGVTVENKMGGTFVIRKKRTTYKWDWWNGGYRKKVELLEQIKPTGEADSKYSLVKKFDNEATGEVIAMVRHRMKGLKLVEGVDYKEMVFIKVKPDLSWEITDRGTFPVGKGLIYSGIVPDISRMESAEEVVEEAGSQGGEDAGDLSVENAGFIFGPPLMGQEQDRPYANEYTYWQVDGNGKIVTKLDFQAPANVWNVTEWIANGNSIYIMGPANIQPFKTAKVSASVSFGGEENIKWKQFQLAKLTNGKLEYITGTPIEEFEAKLKTPPSQKKAPSYTGKKFHFETARIANDGSVFIAGQNFTLNADGETYKDIHISNYKGRAHQDPVMFNFDKTGKLIAQYGVRREENNKYAKLGPADQKITSTANAEYWTIYEMDGYRDEKEGNSVILKELEYPSVARIDRATGNISDFTTFGTVKGKPEFYLHQNFPVLQIQGENSIVYLGANKPGKVLWFGKVVFD